ncbi:MAG: hypothetical protein A3F74_01360 [Betaproteobacteria bacterium RIFCSPLOWO2_12_FULL_62_58]|nr:MAG: hypothetical protein A3F74_01360 [Betaproteobacteria bacterium RIFCSPLOWO2_12_FULL_62_58]
MDAGDPERLLDPRGRLRLARITLAPRPDASALAAGTVLFYDNEKMDVGHYGLIYARIKEGLRGRGISRFCDRRASIRGKTSADIAAMARDLSQLGASAAVIALADMGVSPAMVALAIEMERLGLGARSTSRCSTSAGRCRDMRISPVFPRPPSTHTAWRKTPLSAHGQRSTRSASIAQRRVS